MPLYKFQPNDVRIACTTTGEWCIVDRSVAIRLHTRGLIHPGEEGHTLADGVTWLEIEAELLRLGALEEPDA